MNFRLGLSAIVAAAALAGCDLLTPKARQACHLPILRTSATTSVTETVRHECPVPPPRSLVVRTDNGVLDLEWASGTQFLYMLALSEDRTEQFVVSGDGVEPFSTSSPGVQRYRYGKRFPGNPYDHSPPFTERFELEIQPGPGSSRSFTDRIEFEFDTVPCTCTYVAL
jgi:hypothetical protein